MEEGPAPFPDGRGSSSGTAFLPACSITSVLLSVAFHLPTIPIGSPSRQKSGIAGGATRIIPKAPSLSLLLAVPSTGSRAGFPHAAHHPLPAPRPGNDLSGSAPQLTLKNTTQFSNTCPFRSHCIPGPSAIPGHISAWLCCGFNPTSAELVPVAGIACGVNQLEASSTVCHGDEAA